MTEAEWLACDDPGRMLDFLRGRASDRKLRLFACHSFAKLEPQGIAEEALLAAEFAHLFAEGEATAEDLATARAAGLEVLDTYGFTALAVFEALSCVTSPDIAQVAQTTAHVLEALDYMGPPPEHMQAERAELCALLRDLFGSTRLRPCASDPLWRTPAAVTLARAIYEHRSFERLPELADALEAAGCEDAELLGHCRGLGPHVRGCWALDAVLGRA